MSWSAVIGHEENVERFRRAVRRGRLGSTFLFVGPAGIGKRTFALTLAQTLLCENGGAERFDACGVCQACQQVAASSHPDLILVSKPTGKNAIPVETFIGDRDHRMQQGLCHDISLKPFRGGRKIAIIDDADFLQQEAANSLLKTIEEPPPKSLLILIGTSEQRQLPTIRSRSQIVRFRPLSTEQVQKLLVDQSLLDDPSSAGRLAEQSGGSLEQALQLTDESIFEFRSDWLSQLATLDPGQNDFAKTIATFVDAAGKDASAKRQRLRLVCDMAVNFYSNLLKTIQQLDPELDAEMRNAIEAVQSNWRGSGVWIGNCLTRCMETYEQISANANQTTVIGCLLSDLCRLSHGEAIKPTCA